jgi:hypothetical protein
MRSGKGKVRSQRRGRREGFGSKKKGWVDLQVDNHEYAERCQK